MDQNQQNSQNQSNNNQDLDSLLKEFQSLAVSSEEPAITNENSIQQVNNSVLDGTYSTGVEQNQSVQQTNVVQPLTGTQQMVSTNNTNTVSFQANNSTSVEPAQINTVMGQMQTVTPATVIQPEMSTAVETAVNVEPTETVIQTPVNTVTEQVPTLQSSTVVQSEISTNTAPMVNTEPVQTVIQTPATNVAGQVQSEQEINQADQQQIPVHPDMNVSLEGDGGDKIPVDLSNSNSSSSDNNNAVDEKSNIIFMVVIFAILGAFIMFMPKIDSFFNRKPAMEVKPTEENNTDSNNSKNNSTSTKDATLVKNVSISGYSCFDTICNVSIEESGNYVEYVFGASNVDLFSILGDYDDYVKVNIYYTKKGNEKTIVDYKIYLKSNNKEIKNVKTEGELRSKIGLYSVGTHTASFTLTGIGTTGVGFKDDKSYTYVDYTLVDSKENKYEMKYILPNGSNGLNLVKGNTYSITFEVAEDKFGYEFYIKSVK